MMEKLPLDVASSVFTFKLNVTKTSSIFEIKEVYKPYHEHAIISEVIGHWTSIHGLSMTNEPLWERRKDLRGFQFRIAVVKVSTLTLFGLQLSGITYLFDF